VLAACRSPLNGETRRGAFACAGCGTPLFASAAKYDAGTGWRAQRGAAARPCARAPSPPPLRASPDAPSRPLPRPTFSAALPGAVREVADTSLPFLPRREARCATCEGHLGDILGDGPPPAYPRISVNGAALVFTPDA
jgi:peptide-methionine (R)-S-oxide reductase